jgi:hypothetical protein
VQESFGPQALDSSYPRKGPWPSRKDQKYLKQYPQVRKRVVDLGTLVVKQGMQQFSTD